jgi:hypothetical protein
MDLRAYKNIVLQILPKRRESNTTGKSGNSQRRKEDYCNLPNSLHCTTERVTTRVAIENNRIDNTVSVRIQSRQNYMKAKYLT